MQDRPGHEPDPTAAAAAASDADGLLEAVAAGPGSGPEIADPVFADAAIVEAVSTDAAAPVPNDPVGHAAGGSDPQVSDPAPVAAAPTAVEEDPSAEPQLDNQEVKARAVTGASAMVFRAFAIRAIGLLGNIVLARLLVPEDFGLAALGLTIYTFANTLSEGGIAAGFVRGRRSPTPTDLRAAVAVQSYTSTLIVLVCAAVAAIVGTREAFVAVVMIAAIPLVSLRTPGYLHFERSMNFGPLIRVEVVETLAYFLFAIVVVALGGGVWGLAIGQCIRVATGAFMMVRANPNGFVGPKWNTESIRGMLHFGIRFQGIALAALCVTQGMNIAIAAAAGLAGLGVWALVFRLLQIPLMVFQSLRRVSYPAVARLMANDADDLAVVLNRVAKLSALMGGVMVVAVLAASDPGVVLAFGEKWTDVERLLPLSVAVVFLNGPVSVAAFSYSMASGRLNAGLAGTAAQAVIGPGLVLALYPVLGIPAIALASCAMALFEATVLGSVLWRGLKVNLAPMMLFYGSMVAVAGIAGHLVATSLPANWLAVILSVIVAEAILLGLLFLLQRAVVLDAWRLGRRVAARG